jgi:hypothetical protein
MDAVERELPELFLGFLTDSTAVERPPRQVLLQKLMLLR